jgi:DNA-directed RNA polymerase specialized sigma24 family protein
VKIKSRYPEREELNWIVKEYGEELVQYCLRQGKSPEEAGEAAVRTLFCYADRAPVFRDREREQAWLLGRAKKICEKKRRNRRKIEAADISDTKKLQDLVWNYRERQKIRQVRALVLGLVLLLCLCGIRW